MSQKLRNAISIKFKILMNSISIRLSLVLMLLFSVGIAFWPFISDVFGSDGLVSVQTEIDFGDVEKYNIEIKDEGKDIKIAVKDGTYIIDVLTKDGYIGLDNVKNLIYKKNIDSVIESGTLPDQELMKVMNQNIELNYEYDNKLDENSYNFLMAFVMLYGFLIILLISRISAQVAYEKGNKVTEVILTSLKRKELYFAQVVASIFVVIINLVVVSIPMGVAFIIDNPNITTDLSFFSLEKLVQFIIHLIIATISLVIFAIGLSSRVKQYEDVNAYTAVVIIPLWFSLVYLIFNLDLYRGVLYILNYIPIASIFPVLGAVLNESISNAHFWVIELVTIILTIGEYFVIKRLYTNNIAKR
ncbi:ABC transporter permease [Clostridium gasigenes]|uniref:ABC transporter permease n=1 Tax=Clostridium gasigenes TaxID=94869 RepID=UPI001C0DCD14|nr:ABC transporter permease [Clostridium gasigenes]MBU3089186.1 ABC transporter permease [Clostridium gasigenes]